MLEAEKSRLFESIFAIYNRNLFKRRFHSFNVSGLEFLSERDRQVPLIIFANHSSWWDGLAVFEISLAAGLDSFLMMEEKQLEKLSLFRRLGAFSVVREKPREAIESINYAIGLLKENPNRTLWIFPQGEILPNDLRPIKFYNGISRIIEKLEKSYLAPLALRYEFLNEFKPEIFVKIGAPEMFKVKESFNSKVSTKRFESELTQILDELKIDVLNNNFSNYSKIF